MSNVTYGQEDRASWWRAEGAAYQESGMSLADWVETKDYSQRTFHRNVSTFCPEVLDAFNGSDVTGWSAVHLDLNTPSLTLTHQDVQIEVPSGFDQDLLKEVLEVLRDDH